MPDLAEQIIRRLEAIEGWSEEMERAFLTLRMYVRGLKEDFAGAVNGSVSSSSGPAEPPGKPTSTTSYPKDD